MACDRIFSKCTFIIFILTTLFISIVIGACESDENDIISPYFRIESTKSYNVWADSQFGVWTSRTNAWSSTKFTIDESRESIERNWPNGGLLDSNYEPLLNDQNDGIWFFSHSGYNGGMPYAHFDGEKWLQPILPEISLKAPPNIENSGGPRYLKEGIIDPNKNAVFFEDLGVFIWEENKWIYGSFYDYSTYPEPGDQNRQGWPPPIYLRTEPRSALSSEGIMWFWGVPEADNYKHVPSGVREILRWDGIDLIAMKSFKGIPAEQIQEICFLSNGDTWIFATSEAKSGKGWPVLIKKNENLQTEIPVPLETTSGEILDPSENSAILLFREDEHIYAGIGKRIFRLQSNGLCQEMKEYPWNLNQYVNVYSLYKESPKDIWFLVSINQGRGLFYWNGDQLSLYDTGMGGFVRNIGGVGPDGRVYLSVGNLDSFVISIDPNGFPNPTITPVISTLLNTSNSYDDLWFDDQQRVCLFGVDSLWPPTQRYEVDKWEQLWEPNEPNLPPWYSHLPRPPVNALEEADSRDFIAQNYDEIIELLALPDASFYRHRLRPLGNGRILWDNKGLCIYDGIQWTNMSDLIDPNIAKISFTNLHIESSRNLWVTTGKKWYCIDLPEDKANPIHVKHVIVQIDSSSGRIGLDSENNVWDLTAFGPRFICEIEPEQLKDNVLDSMLCAVDPNKRTYVVTFYKGLLTVSDGVNNWSGFHDSLVSPNQKPRFDFDSKGRIWCCSSMGLLVWDSPSDNEDELKLLHFEPRGSGLNNDQPCFDCYGNLWLTNGRQIPNAEQIEFNSDSFVDSLLSTTD